MQRDEGGGRIRNISYNRVIILLLVGSALAIVVTMALAVWKYSGMDDADPIFQAMFAAMALFTGLYVANWMVMRWY